MEKFELVSSYQPTGDQPEAIDALVQGVQNGLSGQVLKGVTGSGKTFTMANVIAKLNRPTLVLAHNKTLAAQLCNEFREFFHTIAWNFLSVITTITSQKPISCQPIHTSRKICQSMTKSTNFVTAPPPVCSLTATQSWLPVFPAFMVWAHRKNITIFKFLSAKARKLTATNSFADSSTFNISATM